MVEFHREGAAVTEIEHLEPLVEALRA
jgi:hypothetical protein